MSNRRQLLVSALVVGGAVALVAFQLTTGEPAPTAGGMEGHDHAAMTAARQRQPVELSSEDARRIGVSLTAAELRSLEPTLEALGTVVYDETRLTTVTPRIEGWVERLHVDFTGAPVRRGEPLASVYSPELVTAQEELVLAARLRAEATGGRVAENADRLLEAARRRLEYWDVPEDEIRRVEETGEVRRALTLTAPASGIVVEKAVTEGDRIAPGDVLYRIADLATVWVEADIFEKDLGLVREGQDATAGFAAYPGRDFPARVTYVHPTVSMETRTGRIRLELANPDGRLKPGMYARISLQAPPTEASVVVPRSAVLSTGERSLVFVEDAAGALVPREVTPGRTVGRSTEILAGLEPGERVVASAAFLVDAESNLGALTGGTDASGTMDHSEHRMERPDTTDPSGHSGH